MTLGIIEGVLLMGMVGLIWVMLDILAGDLHANDKQQGSMSPSYHHSLHQPVLSGPASQEQQAMVFLPTALIERLRNAAYWMRDRPLTDLVAEVIEHTVNQMEEVNGEAFPRHLSPLKREAMTRNALSGPLN